MLGADEKGGFGFGEMSPMDILADSKDNNTVKSKSKILVIGVGGCGGNIADAMYAGTPDDKKEDIGFLLCNTDEDALNSKSVPMTLVLGPNITMGKGAGGDPKVGEEAANDSEARIRRTLEEIKPDMVFITAGMGGGTGTGAAHKIAGITKDLGILTVGVFTMPFANEGKRKIEYAANGLEKAIENLDGRLIINNEELFNCGTMTKQEAYNMANNVLIEAATGISDIILTQFRENIDFRDVNTCIRGQGLINIGTAYASVRTPDTPRKLINKILTSPLVADKDIYGSKNIIATVRYGKNGLMMNEMNAILRAISEASGGMHELMKFADAYDADMEDDAIRLTLIATGYLGSNRILEEQQKVLKEETHSGRSRTRGFFDTQDNKKMIGRHRKEYDNTQGNIPAYKRRKKNISCYVDDGKAKIIEFKDE